MHSNDVQETLYQNCEFMVPGSGIQVLRRGQFGRIVKLYRFYTFVDFLSTIIVVGDKSCIGIMFIMSWARFFERWLNLTLC